MINENKAVVTNQRILCYLEFSQYRIFLSKNENILYELEDINVIVDPYMLKPFYEYFKKRAVNTPALEILFFYIDIEKGEAKVSNFRSTIKELNNEYSNVFLMSIENDSKMLN